LVTFTLPGMRFYFMGQREGYANRLDIHLRYLSLSALLYTL
jgi:hypothetical protein